jgi:hypothetical protein
MKLIALAAMTLDHLAAFQFPELIELRVIGRAAAPLFLFLVGYNGSYGFRWPLLIAALLVTAGDGLLGGHWYPQNILWSILLGRMALALIERRHVAPWALLLGCAIWYVPLSAVVECSTVGLVWMLFGRAMRQAPQSSEAALYGSVGFIGAALQTAILYRWGMEYELAAIMVCAAAWVLMWRFTPKPIARDTAWLRVGSRHALAYYVVHKLALQAV